MYAPPAVGLGAFGQIGIGACEGFEGFDGTLVTVFAELARPLPFVGSDVEHRVDAPPASEQHPAVAEVGRLAAANAETGSPQAVLDERVDSRTR